VKLLGVLKNGFYAVAHDLVIVDEQHVKPHSD
jgi:hypothetical protein